MNKDYRIKTNGTFFRVEFSFLWIFWIEIQDNWLMIPRDFASKESAEEFIHDAIKRDLYRELPWRTL